MQEESDSALIARAKEDPEAFSLLYERYVDKIYNYIYYRTSNHHDAEDLVSRTFYRALKHFPRYEDRGIPFSAYLYRIAHNIVANWHRDNSRRQIVSLNEQITSSVRREQPAAVVQDKDEQKIMLKAVHHLAEDRQELLYLKFIEQLSNAEIGEIMGRTEGAIKSLYHRTLVALREDLIDSDKLKGRTRDEGKRH